MEPQNSGVYDYLNFLEGDYSTLGSIKVVKVIITYMDKTVDEITDENVINAICFPPKNIIPTLPKIKEPIKLATPTESPIYIHFDIDEEQCELCMDIVYIGDEGSDDDEDYDDEDYDDEDYDDEDYDDEDNESKTIISICMKRTSGYASWVSASPLNPQTRSKLYCQEEISDVNYFRKTLDQIIIFYEDNTYITIPERMIDSITSDDNFKKAEKLLEKLLHEAEEKARREVEIKAKREAEEKARLEAEEAEKEARKNACCAEILNRAQNFLNTPNDLTAASLLDGLNAYCPNDEVMATNYLTKEYVASVCGKALQMIVFYTNNNVVQPRRDAAKSFLERIAPDLISEKAFDEFKNDWSEKLRSEIDSRAHNFLKQPDDFTAASLLAKLNAYCPNDDVMAANYLTKDNVTSACGKALQMIVFYTNNNVTQSCRDDAKSFLERIAPDLISETAFDEFKNDWSEKLRSEIDSHAHSFLKKPNDINAESLLNKLNEYCPNDVVMATNYLTKEIVISACGKALQMIVFNTNNNVTQAHRDGAKSFLKHIAPELYSIESRAHIFLNQPDDLTAASLLAELNAYCPNDDVMAANYLTKDIVTSACGKALQMIIFNTNNNVTQAHRDDAKSFLNRLAPQLNSMKSYKRANSSKKINGCLLAIIIAVAIVVGLVIIVTFMGILIAIVTS